MNNLKRMQVTWYRKNGEHQNRIKREGLHPFDEYVIGDDAWNRNHPYKREFVEHLMPRVPDTQRAGSEDE